MKRVTFPMGGTCAQHLGWTDCWHRMGIYLQLRWVDHQAFGLQGVYSCKQGGKRGSGFIFLFFLAKTGGKKDLKYLKRQASDYEVWGDTRHRTPPQRADFCRRAGVRLGGQVRVSDE